MGDTEPGSGVTTEVIALCVEALVMALTQRGLYAHACAGSMVVAKNSAADPDEDDPLALISPGMRQTVTCQADETGQLSWFWAWSGPTPDAPPELEYLGPAGHIGETADRIANVLRVENAGLEPMT
ncbi:hypothetical protein [Actinoallomurus acaciae]|uniref:Uncharacterized protein n=1 Tax=Actinoallomurus acaciae TaxID=502577 RepID=A0ABV5Y7F4_9ACTN